MIHISERNIFRNTEAIYPPAREQKSRDTFGTTYDSQGHYILRDFGEFIIALCSAHQLSQCRKTSSWSQNTKRIKALLYSFLPRGTHSLTLFQGHLLYMARTHLPYCPYIHNPQSFFFFFFFPIQQTSIHKSENTSFPFNHETISHLHESLRRHHTRGANSLSQGQLR